MMDEPTNRGGAGGKRERTRATLVRATLAVVEAKGFAQASLADIAAEAGMSTGAIYSNFSGKAELLYAAMASKALILAPAYLPDAPLKAQLRAAAEALIAILPRSREEARFVSEYYVYSLGDAELAERNRASYAAQFTALSDVIESRYGAQLAMPPRTLMVAIQCLGLGLIDQYARTPGEITPEVVIAAYEALAGGATRSVA